MKKFALLAIAGAVALASLAGPAVACSRTRVRLSASSGYAGAAYALPTLTLVEAAAPRVVRVQLPADEPPRRAAAAPECDCEGGDETVLQLPARPRRVQIVEAPARVEHYSYSSAGRFAGAASHGHDDVVLLRRRTRSFRGAAAGHVSSAAVQVRAGSAVAVDVNAGSAAAVQARGADVKVKVRSRSR